MGSLHELKLCQAIPDELHRDGEDEEAEDAVDGAACRGTEAFHKWSAKTQKEKDNERESRDAEHHPNVAEPVTGGCGHADHHADGTWSGEHGHRHGRERDVLLSGGFRALRGGYATCACDHVPC